MPKTTSAKKALRQNKKRHEANLENKAKIKAAIKEYRHLLVTDPKKAATYLSTIYQVIDKVLKTKFIKKNRASRLKSRLAKKLTAQNKV